MFEIRDVVEVILWEGAQRINWVIIGFASGGAEAHLLQFPSGVQTFVEVSKLKRQKDNKIVEAIHV